MDCVGRPKKTCKENCFFTKGSLRKYCRKRTGTSCRGRNVNACFEKNKCKVARGESREFCRKKFNKTKKFKKSSSF